jgi:hypothetical protein
MAEVLNQGHLILVCPEKPYPLREGTRSDCEAANGRYALQAGAYLHHLPADKCAVYTARRANGRHPITVIEVRKPAKLTSDGHEPMTLGAGTWYVAEQ